jgi:hypothetical protein
MSSRGHAAQCLSMHGQGDQPRSTGVAQAHCPYPPVHNHSLLTTDSEGSNTLLETNTCGRPFRRDFGAPGNLGACEQDTEPGRSENPRVLGAPAGRDYMTLAVAAGPFRNHLICGRPAKD